jgi:hypothetical protein
MPPGIIKSKKSKRNQKALTPKKAPKPPQTPATTPFWRRNWLRVSLVDIEFSIITSLLLIIRRLPAQQRFRAEFGSFSIQHYAECGRKLQNVR